LLRTLLKDAQYNWIVFVMSREKLCAWLSRKMMFKEVVVSYFHYLFCWRDLGKPRSVFPIVVHEEASEYKAAFKRGTATFGLEHYHVDSQVV